MVSVVAKRERVLEVLRGAPWNCKVRESEEWGYNDGGIVVLSTEEQNKLFNYWACDWDFECEHYTFGIANALAEAMCDLGWYCSWYDSGTVMVWEI
jgi:hypothetical protein